MEPSGICRAALFLPIPFLLNGKSKTLRECLDRIALSRFYRNKKKKTDSEIDVICLLFDELWRFFRCLMLCILYCFV